jgi:hypothetical protein
MTGSPESSLHAVHILRAWGKGEGLPPLAAGVYSAAPPNALEEERREVLASVLWELRTAEPARDRLTACRFLLSHLAGARALPAGAVTRPLPPS